jgi:hypothetical protein
MLQARRTKASCSAVTPKDARYGYGRVDRWHVLAAFVAGPGPLGNASTASARPAVEVLAEALAQLQAHLAHATADGVHLDDLMLSV